MARILLIGGSAQSLANFRGDLIRALVGAGHEVIGMADPTDDRVLSQITALGASYRSFPVQRSGMNPFKDLETLRDLRRAFRELKPDIVLAYTIKPVIWGGIALRGGNHTRFYALITGLGFAFQSGDLKQNLLTSLVSRLYAASLKRASKVIFQNPDNRDLFVSRGIASQETCAVVDGSGVDLDTFRQAPLPEEGAVFLLIARFLKAKGIREYAQAARTVKSRHPDARFWLVGMEDPSPDGIKLAEVETWQKEGIIEYMGEADDVRPYLADSHVYVLPSYYLEGIPRTLLEAMATGRPLLTTDTAGCRETVSPGSNGFLVAPRDADALAERMSWLLENRSVWSDMGARSRQMAEERFDVHLINQALFRLMELD